MSNETPVGRGHWDGVYLAGDTGKSWYQPQAATSLRLIEQVSPSPSSVIDVGGGASTLVDGLLRQGWTDLTVLDIADAGLSIARERLGPSAEQVDWITADLLAWQPPRTFDVWHDRAVLHFMSPDQVVAYRDVLLRATAPGSRAVIGVFGPQGPTQCSQLPVQRYDAAALADVLGPGFEVLADSREVHRTPAGAEQEFQWIAALRSR